MRTWQKWTLGLAGFGIVTGALVVARGARKQPSSLPLTPPTPVLNIGDTVLLVGDSIGVGIGPALKPLLAQHGVSLVSYAHQGDAAGATANLILQNGVPQRQRMMIASLGSNDAAGNANSPINALRMIRSKAVRIDGPSGQQPLPVPLWWLEPPSFQLPASKVPSPANVSKQKQFRDAIDSSSFDASVAPDSDVMAQIAGDRIHLTPTGYKLYAEQIAASMKFSDRPAETNMLSSEACSTSRAAATNGGCRSRRRRSPSIAPSTTSTTSTAARSRTTARPSSCSRAPDRSS
jgi:lysophospholipase L1-like esterase